VSAANKQTIQRERSEQKKTTFGEAIPPKIHLVNNFCGEKCLKVLQSVAKYTTFTHEKQTNHMSSLIGNTEGKIDAKGRAFLPATFRRLLSDETAFYIRKGVFQNCLVLYPEAAWENTMSELRRQLNPWNREEDSLFRQFVAEADRIELEDNGRMLLPKRLLQAAGITSSVRFLGHDTVIEIWPLGKVEETFTDTESYANKMQDLLKNARIPIQV
jgi:MraZ protein